MSTCTRGAGMRVTIFVFIGCLVTAPVARAGEPVDFDKQIRPLLAEHCLACHGPEKSKDSLRLDQKDLALDGGESGKVILPGHAQQSLLVKLLQGPVGDADQMPKKKDPLSPDQIALISRWIDEGALWPKGPPIAAAKHWSFIPPAR